MLVEVGTKHARAHHEEMVSIKDARSSRIKERTQGTGSARGSRLTAMCALKSSALFTAAPRRLEVYLAPHGLQGWRLAVRQALHSTGPETEQAVHKYMQLKGQTARAGLKEGEEQQKRRRGVRRCAWALGAYQGPALKGADGLLSLRIGRRARLASSSQRCLTRDWQGSLRRLIAGNQPAHLLAL